MEEKSKTNSHASVASDDRRHIIEELSQGSLRIEKDPRQGTFVVAKRCLLPAQVLLECPSACIALDPTYRQSHCGYCASPCSINNTTTSSEEAEITARCCKACHILSICAHCREKGVEQWHNQSGECVVLKSLVESFLDLFSEFEGLSLSEAALHVESIYILTVRLLLRRQLDQQKDLSKQTLHCPLPEIDWSLFDTLYSSPLPSSESGSFVAAMASLFQSMNLKLQKKFASNGGIHAFDPQECVSIWSKCRGCSHAVTDLSQPLGAQNLGMALFVPQSFFNHGCAPNAFLSCLLAGENNNNTLNNNNRPCAVMSRVVCCTNEASTTVSQGESVTLSYIPLSSLCRRERQVRLREVYHFVCTCKVCQEADIPNSDGCALEKAVGGEYAAALTHDKDLDTLTPLRELQINCHQQLVTASTMKVVYHSASSVGSEENDEEDPRTDLIEQTIATLEMAQRGIRNQKLPPSHEISLECHRLLARAYSLLRQDSMRTRDCGDDYFDKEVHHHEQFFQNVAPILRIFDPSTLTIQHFQMIKCLQSQLKDSNEGGVVSGKHMYHLREIRSLATRSLGMDHPFVVSLRLPGWGEDELSMSTSSSSDTKKRKLNAN